MPLTCFSRVDCLFIASRYANKKFMYECVSERRLVFMRSFGQADPSFECKLLAYIQQRCVKNTVPFPFSRLNRRRSLERLAIQLDVFLDLADPQCAKAWPTLKRAVRDNEYIMEFVFHAVPLAANPIAVDYAKVNLSPSLCS